MFDMPSWELYFLARRAVSESGWVYCFDHARSMLYLCSWILSQSGTLCSLWCFMCYLSRFKRMLDLRRWLLQWYKCEPCALSGLLNRLLDLLRCLNLHSLLSYLQIKRSSLYFLHSQLWCLHHQCLHNLLDRSRPCGSYLSCLHRYYSARINRMH